MSTRSVCQLALSLVLLGGALDAGFAQSTPTGSALVAGTEAIGAAVRRANCARGRQVVACSWNGSHSWPAGDDGVYFAHKTVWRFFKKNRKPR